MSPSGWVKLHRKFLNWGWRSDHKTLALFIYLLLSVNFEKKKWLGKDIPRGSIVTSLPKLAENVGLSVKQIRGSLDKLEKTGEIIRFRSSHSTIITLKKFGFYQDDYRVDSMPNNELLTEKGNITGHSLGNQGAFTGQTEGIHRAATKEFKNLNNNKNLKNADAREDKNLEYSSFKELLRAKGLAE